MFTFSIGFKVLTLVILMISMQITSGAHAGYAEGKRVYRHDPKDEMNWHGAPTTLPGSMVGLLVVFFLFLLVSFVVFYSFEMEVEVVDFNGYEIEDDHGGDDDQHDTISISSKKRKNT